MTFITLPQNPVTAGMTGHLTDHDDIASALASLWRTTNESAYDVKSSTYGAAGDGITDDTSAINAAISAAVAAGGGVVWIPAGTYKITSAITAASKVTIRGAGVDATILQQSSTTAAGISGTSLVNFGLMDLTVSGPSSGSGKGVFLNDSSGSNINQSIVMMNLKITGFGGDGLKLMTPIVSTIVNVTSVTNGGIGINVDTSFTGGTSIGFYGCYGLANTGNNWQLTKLTYSLLSGCASDNTSADGYYIDACHSITLVGSGCENSTNGFVIHASVGVTLLSCFNYHNNGVAFWVTAGSTEVNLLSIEENGPGGSATASLKTDSGTQSVLCGIATSTATSLASNTVNILNDGGLNVTIAGISYVGAFNTYGVLSINAGSNTSASAPVLTPTLSSGTAAQLSDTTRDYFVTMNITTSGTSTHIEIGPTSTPANTVLASASVTAGQVISFRLPAGWYIKWTGTTTALSTLAVGC